MRFIVLMLTMFILAGCSAMLLGGAPESEQRTDCTETEKEADKRGC